MLIAHRHGLRASELVGLEWHQVELDGGRLHVRRAKNGTPSVHPTRGDEIRALRRLRREHPTNAHVVVADSVLAFGRLRCVSAIELNTSKPLDGDLVAFEA